MREGEAKERPAFDSMAAMVATGAAGGLLRCRGRGCSRCGCGCSGCGRRVGDDAADLRGGDFDCAIVVAMEIVHGDAQEGLAFGGCADLLVAEDSLFD